jgi:hypothetical protein
MFWVMLATLVVVLVYTGAAISQVLKTQAANEIAQDGIYIANRPYVMFDTLSPINQTDEKEKLSFYRLGPNWMNFGNTPAANTTFYICDPIVTDSPAQPNLVCNISEKAIPSGPLGPKQQWHVVGVSIKPDDYDATQFGNRHIFVFGYVIYTDGLRPDKLHQTRFCQQVIKPQCTRQFYGRGLYGRWEVELLRRRLLW